MHTTSKTTTSTLDVDGAIYTISECPPTPCEPILEQDNSGTYPNAINFHDKMIWGSKRAEGGMKKVVDTP